MLHIVYFAQVREAIGMDGETRKLLAGTNISALLDQLVTEDGRYAEAFSDRSKLRFALDCRMAREDAQLDGAKELAIFPPVTGG
jgi:molybdopterin synthase sulfur carrier subunit